MNKKGEATIALTILILGFVIGIIEIVKDAKNTQNTKKQETEQKP